MSQATLFGDDDEPDDEQPVVPDVAHARRSDPVTSHEAAASIPSEKIRISQDAILTVFRRVGPMYDEELQSHYLRLQGIAGLPAQSESGIRTRRKELVDKGRLRDSGRKVTPPGKNRRSIVWELCS